jgi:hypothetical protein
MATKMTYANAAKMLRYTYEQKIPELLQGWNENSHMVNGRITQDGSDPMGQISNAQQLYNRQIWWNGQQAMQGNSPASLGIVFGQDQAATTQNPGKCSKQKGKGMFGFAKEYLDRHKDCVGTIVFVLVIDWFFFGGALRHKVRVIAEDMLNNAQKRLSHTPEAPAAKPDAA